MVILSKGGLDLTADHSPSPEGEWSAVLEDGEGEWSAVLEDGEGEWSQ